VGNKENGLIGLGGHIALSETVDCSAVRGLLASYEDIGCLCLLGRTKSVQYWFWIGIWYLFLGGWLASACSLSSQLRTLSRELDQELKLELAPFGCERPAFALCSSKLLVAGSRNIYSSGATSRTVDGTAAPSARERTAMITSRGSRSRSRREAVVVVAPSHQLTRAPSPRGI